MNVLANLRQTFCTAIAVVCPSVPTLQQTDPYRQHYVILIYLRYAQTLYLYNNHPAAKKTYRLTFVASYPSSAVFRCLGIKPCHTIVDSLLHFYYFIVLCTH